MANEVEIRFQITEDKATPTTPTNASSWRSIDESPQNKTQREREIERKTAELQEKHSDWQRFEHRIEHKLRHIGARLIASQLVEEGADLLGIGHSFVGRLGEHAIEGFMMGGAYGAGLKTVGALVHQLAEIIKGHSEQLKKNREQIQKQEEESRNFAIELRAEERDRLRESEDKTREILEEFRREIQAENLNVTRFISQPYLGAIGG